MSDAWLPALEFFGALRWIDKAPLLDHVEAYRQALFTQALDAHDEAARLRYNLILSGRAKKNWKSADLVLAALFALVGNDAPGGNDCYLFGNDEEQAGDDLSLVKKIVQANPVLLDRLAIKQKVVERRDGAGFLMILPAQDVAGSHGKTYRFCGFDEIHGYRDWDILEAMQLDPTRGDAQQWITSYASLYHRPGIPLFDLCAQGRAGADPRMLFSWYAADYTTDAAFAEADPESRANPSRDSWGDADYLAQQARRLPAHKYRRLHLNLPGLPEGSAFTAESVMAAVERGVTGWGPEAGAEEVAHVDMAGGSNDDSVLVIARKLADGRVAVVKILNQGPPPPYDPRAAVDRFARVLKEYGLSRVRGDKYSGETFIRDFERAGITYEVDGRSASELYEAFEPLLNSGQVVLPDVPLLEQQLLGLVWRGNKITHPGGEHDDWANAAAGAVVDLAEEDRDDLGISVGDFSGDRRELVYDDPTSERNPHDRIRREQDEAARTETDAEPDASGARGWRAVPESRGGAVTGAPIVRKRLTPDPKTGLVKGRLERARDGED